MLPKFIVFEELQGITASSLELSNRSKDTKMVWFG